MGGGERVTVNKKKQKITGRSQKRNFVKGRSNHFDTGQQKFRCQINHCMVGSRFEGTAAKLQTHSVEIGKQWWNTIQSRTHQDCLVVEEEDSMTDFLRRRNAQA